MKPTCSFCCTACAAVSTAGSLAATLMVCGGLSSLPRLLQGAISTLVWCCRLRLLSFFLFCDVKLSAAVCACTCRWCRFDSCRAGSQAQSPMSLVSLRSHAPLHCCLTFATKHLRHVLVPTKKLKWIVHTSHLSCCSSLLLCLLPRLPSLVSQSTWKRCRPGFSNLGISWMFLQASPAPGLASLGPTAPLLLQPHCRSQIHMH